MTIRSVVLICLLGLAPPAHGQSGITTGNTSKYIGNNRWEWTVFIVAPPATLSKVSCVEYLLHPTFPNRDRYVCDRGENANQAFPLTANGWGVFTIPVKVIFADGHTKSLNHSLQFEPRSAAPPDCQSVTSFSLREHGIHDLGVNFPNLYLYAEEIHESRASHFYLIQTKRAIDPSDFDWQRFRQSAQPKKVSNLSVSDSDAYEVFSSAANKKARMTVAGGSSFQVYFGTAANHGSIRVDICK